MTDIAIFRINYKSDFILTLNSDAGWMTPFCIKFWTGAPSQAYFAGFDGTTYTHCAPVAGDPTKLLVQFDDHHLPIGDLQFQIAYHFTVADFPTSVEDEVINQSSVIIEVDNAPAQVMLDLNGETAPEIEFSLPAYANEAQRIANEEQRIAAEAIRIVNEESRIAAETIRQQNEAQRISNEESRVAEFAQIKQESETATTEANAAATLANEKAQLAADKAALADDAATLANAKAQLAADKAALADAAATLANDKATLAQQKAEYAQTQGDYAKAQGDYAKDQGEIAEEDHERADADHTRAESDHTTAGSDHTQAGTDHTRAESDHATATAYHTQAGQDHTRAESDHTQATSDHTQAGTDHTRAESDHATASADHTQAGQDHTRAESDHTRAESDHAAVEVYVDSLGAFDISAYHATGGVLAKYADLTAALGTNGANIPDNIRKGGMSVKFVLSSDNKYVSFRYLLSSTTNANFTNTANWQGVSEIPTEGSRDLISSDGIVKQVDVILNGQTINYLKNTSCNSAGNAAALSGWGMFIENIPCNAGDTIVWNPLKNTGTSKNSIVFFDSNNVKIINYSANALSRTITAPAGTSYLRCCFSMLDGNGKYNYHPLYINGVEYRRLENIESLNATAEYNIRLNALETENVRRLSYKYIDTTFGYNYSSAGNILKGNNNNYLGWTVSEDFIPVNEGDVIKWNFGTYTNSSQRLIVYDTNKNVLADYTANDGGGTRNITALENWKYIRVSFYKTFDNKPNNTPVLINGTPYFIDELSTLISHDAILFPTDAVHGIIGESYPEEIAEINKFLSHEKNSNYHRFQFLHISDNHNGSFGYAENYLDYSPAKFLINTGDLVNDQFSDSAATTIAKAIVPEKPVYLVLGNHDYSHASSNQAVFDKFFGSAETEGTVNYHNNQAEGTVTNKTYYSIDFATEKVKCIMLDMNDGWDDAELPDVGPSSPGTTSGKMSQTQINWLVAQLQDAKTNNYHVCVFIHTLPYNVDTDKRISGFCDVLKNSGLGVNSALTFLPSIIDGFINGGNVAFDYNGNSYSFTFTAGGHFISWFCGHTHYDMAGWMQGHENQFMINVCRPFPDTSAYLGTYDEDKLGVHFNFVTVDTNIKSLSVYRVGQQDTVFATKRKSFRIIYK